MRWVRDSPCLVLQWVDNKVVSMITTAGNANDHGQVSRRVRNDGQWTERLVWQPRIFQTYNMKMNAVDRSDQILSAFSTQRKCVRWWKTLFFRLIDIAVVNSFILFSEHRPTYPEIESPAGYSQCDFRDEIVREICNFPEYGDPLNILLGGQGLNLLCLKHNIFPFSPKKGNPVLSVTNRTKCRERFIPIVPHHNVRRNICMSPWTESVFRFFTAKNITANKYSLGLWCIEFRYCQIKWTKKRVSTKKFTKNEKKTSIILVKEVWKQNDVLYLWDLLKLGFVSF